MIASFLQLFQRRLAMPVEGTVRPTALRRATVKGSWAAQTQMDQDPIQELGHPSLRPASFAEVEALLQKLQIVSRLIGVR